MAEITLVIPAAPGIHLDALVNIKDQSRPVDVIVEEGRNPSANRNRGATRAATPLIAFVNAHTVLRTDWAERAERFFETYPAVDIVGGPQLNYIEDPYFARLSGDALASPFCTGKMNRRYRAGEVDLDADESSLTSANLICRRSVFEKVRFDEHLYPGEDPKFITEAKRAGFKVASASDIVVFNRRRTSPLALWKQVFNYGATRVQKETAGELMRRFEFFAPSLLVIYLFALPALAWWIRSAWLPVVFYVLLAEVFALVKAKECRRWDYVVALPPLFLWIHLAYGFGFLSRLLQAGWAPPNSRTNEYPAQGER